MKRTPLSILDLAPIRRGETASDSFAASVVLAQRAEELGYERVWYAEHHNIAGIASSATSVLIAHVGAHTKTIRLGAGGVMLPDRRAPDYAEQFGTLEAMYPGRIDLGLGRAPGSDRTRCTRFGHDRARRTPYQDVLELQGYLCRDPVRGVDAVPARALRFRSTLWDRRSSGRSWPRRSGFRMRSPPASLRPPSWRRSPRTGRTSAPSVQLEQHPDVMVGVNVIAADTVATAREQLQELGGSGPSACAGVASASRSSMSLTSRPDELLPAGVSAQVDHMLTYAAAGTPSGEERDYLDESVTFAGKLPERAHHGAPGPGE